GQRGGLKTRPPLLILLRVFCMPWHFRGLPHYLNIQGDRLGVSRILTDRARHNPECHRITTLLGQLAELYHKSPKDDTGGARVALPMLNQVRGTLGQAEDEASKLHALAAAAEAMLNEAHAAFGLVPPDRMYRVKCSFDDVPSEADLRPIK